MQFVLNFLFGFGRGVTVGCAGSAEGCDPDAFDSSFSFKNALAKFPSSPANGKNVGVLNFSSIAMISSIV